jgi:LysR family transcriptional activator of nhaA
MALPGDRPPGEESPASERAPLNFHHLYLFWMVAKSGGMTRAAAALDMAASSLSAQVTLLERTLGIELLRRAGRGVTLTDAGQQAYRAAEEIFALGRDLTSALRGEPLARPLRLAVGIADVVPQAVAARLLVPLRELPRPPHLVCSGGRQRELLDELAAHRIDAALLDAPPGPALEVPLRARRVGASPLVALGAPALVAAHRAGFPGSLHGAPLLLPGAGSALRPLVDRWLDERALLPRVVAEVDDAALAAALAARGAGLLVQPALCVADAGERHGLALLGRLEGAAADFWLVALRRRIEHPGVAALWASSELEAEGAGAA